MKRFTETDKWEDPWYRALSPEFKLAWQYLCDKCDPAGVIQLDRELADFQIGTSVNWEEFLDASEGRVEGLAKGRLWVCGFIQFQYGTLSEGCAPHRQVIGRLEKHGLSERVMKGYQKPSERHKDKDKEKDKGKDKEEGGCKGGEFEEFWAAFPSGRKRSKGDARKAFDKAAKKVEPAKLVTFAREYAASPVASSEFVKMPSSWLNQECWNDDRAAWGIGGGPKLSEKSRKSADAARSFLEKFNGQQSDDC